MHNDNNANLTPEDANHLASKVARQQIMEAGEAFIVDNGSRVYKVKSGWECEQLKLDSAVAHAQSSTEFEQAMQNPDADTIFIPQAASLNEEMITRVVNRNALDKVIFWEA